MAGGFIKVLVTRTNGMSSGPTWQKREATSCPPTSMYLPKDIKMYKNENKKAEGT